MKLFFRYSGILFVAVNCFYAEKRILCLSVCCPCIVIVVVVVFIIVIVIIIIVIAIVI